MASTALKVGAGIGTAAAAGGGGVVYYKVTETEVVSSSEKETTGKEESSKLEETSINRNSDVGGGQVSEKTVTPNTSTNNNSVVSPTLTPIPTSNPKAITVTALTETSSFVAGEDETKENTFGYRYWLLLADPDLNTNENWWNQQFKVWEGETNKDSNFIGLTKGYSDSASEASLNQKCKAVYSKVDENFVTNNNDNFSSTKETDLTRNFWKFCSLLEARPRNLTEEKQNNTSNNTAANFLFPNLLAATKAGVNDKFWDLKQKWYESIKQENNEEQQKFVTHIGTQNSSKTLREICSGDKGNAFDQSSYRDSYKAILKRCSFLNYPAEKLLTPSKGFPVASK